MAPKQPHPLVFLKPLVPSERFRAWVRQFGVSRLGRALGVSRSTVHSWICKPHKRRPKDAETVALIIGLSMKEPSDGRPLTYEDVHGRVEVSR